MTTMTIDEAAADLKRLIHDAAPGDEIVLTENDLPVARLLPVQEGKHRVRGTAKGQLVYMADDFDAPLEDMKE